MRTKTPNPRGMALIMAMIVVVLVTLLVAGAISFTGTELAASQVQTQEDVMSSCVQAARNLVLSKVDNVNFNPGQLKFDEKLGSSMVHTGHLGGLKDVYFKEVSESMQNADEGVQDIANTDRVKSTSRFLLITAVCRENDKPHSPEREIEFMVRVGL